MTQMKILDACCGSKMFWYDKHEPHTTYMDQRKASYQVKDRDQMRTINVDPDIIADFRDMDFPDNTFDLVIFDPPHLVRAGQNSWLRLKYGALPKDHWRPYIKAGFDECMRVLKPTGTLLFKWSTDQIAFYEVLRAIGYKPILGDKRGHTRWSVFIKNGDENT